MASTNEINIWPTKRYPLALAERFDLRYPKEAPLVSQRAMKAAIPPISVIVIVAGPQPRYKKRAIK